MSLRRRTRAPRVPTVVVTGLALLGLLAACGDDPDEADDPASSTPATTTESEPSESEPTEPSEPTDPSESTSTEPSEPTEPSETTESTRPPATTGLTGALVPAAELPGLNAETGWTKPKTSSREGEPPAWVCQQATMLSNGAVTVRQRSYQATEGGATATQVVARTVDPRSAKRVYGALLGNARECAKELTDRDRKPKGQVRALTEIDVPTGQASWGVIFSGPVPGSRDEAYIDAVVVARVGDLVSVLSMSSIGQDYNYEVGQTPPEQTAPIVVDRLAAVR